MSSDFEETSAVFPYDKKPLRLTREQLLSFLDRVRLAVEHDDSMEGSFMYAWSPEPGMYDVGGVVRFGNSQGQGSAVVLWEME